MATNLTKFRSPKNNIFLTQNGLKITIFRSGCLTFQFWPKSDENLVSENVHFHYSKLFQNNDFLLWLPNPPILTKI